MKLIFVFPCSRMLLMALALLAAQGAALRAEPAPGDVFKEFHWTRGSNLLVFGPDATDENAPRNRKPPMISLDLDLQDAIRAEAVVEHWSGHVGTSKKSIRFNDGSWILFPLPQGTPGEAECMYAIVSQPAVEVPLKDLRHGANQFTFTCGPPICHNFNYPAFGVFGVTVRIYYAPTRPHPRGRIVSPASGSRLTGSPLLSVEAASPNGAIARVDYIGAYEDFPWGGDGVYDGWKYKYTFGKLRRHIGTATEASGSVQWDTRWLPDQQAPMQLMARITDATGMTTVTPLVDGLTIERPHQIKMCRPVGVAGQFHSRVGKKATCTFDVPDALQNIASARLVLATHGPHDQDAEFGLNGQRLGVVPHQPTGKGHEVEHVVDVPLTALRAGKNEFYTHCETKGHAVEVLWPGPVLLVEVKR